MKLIRNPFSLIKQTSVLPLAVVALLASCGQQPQEQPTEEPIVEEAETEEAEKVTYPIPSPLELTKMLNEAGASFIFDITNPPSSVDSYMSESAQALNLGAYGSDLSYSVTYNKTQQAQDFFECTKKLRSSLSIQAPYMNNLASDVERNIENKDSLYVLLNESFENTFEFLNAHEKAAVSGLVLAGGWIEGTYLAAELVALSEDKNALVQIVANQGGTLEALNGFLETCQDDEAVSKLLVQLKELASLYGELEAEDGSYNITDDKFEAIQAKVAALRAELISAN